MRAPTDHESAVLDALVKVARPIILEEFNPDSCIASTRIGIDVLDYFGIPGQEVPLFVIVFNAEAAEAIEAGASMEEVQSQMRAISPHTPGGPWSIGIGAGTGQGWAGHLVIGAPHLGAVVDLSLDQASRPLKQLNLEPYWQIVPDEQWWDGSNPIVFLRDDNGTRLGLDRRAKDLTGYRSSPNWRRVTNGDKSLYKTLTGRIIREVRSSLR